MRTTRQVLRLIQAANPRTPRISEDVIRTAFRSDKVRPPSLFAGRFCWTDRDIADLCAALKLRVPDEITAIPEGAAR